MTDYDQEDKQKAKTFYKISVTVNGSRISLLQKGKCIFFF